MTNTTNTKHRKTSTPEKARELAERRRSHAAGVHKDGFPRGGYDRRNHRLAAIREQIA